MGPGSVPLSAQQSVDRGSDSADGKKSQGKDAGAADTRANRKRGVQKAKDPKKAGRKGNAEARNSKQGGPADQMQ